MLPFFPNVSQEVVLIVEILWLTYEVVSADGRLCELSSQPSGLLHGEDFAKAKGSREISSVADTSNPAKYCCMVSLSALL